MPLFITDYPQLFTATYYPGGFWLSLSVIILLGIGGWNRIETYKRKVKLILIVRLETIVSVTE